MSRAALNRRTPEPESAAPKTVAPESYHSKNAVEADSVSDQFPTRFLFCVTAVVGRHRPCRHAAGGASHMGSRRQAIAQLAHLYSCRGCCLRIQARRSHPGEGIDLEECHRVTILVVAHDEVDPVDFVVGDD